MKLKKILQEAQWPDDEIQKIESVAQVKAVESGTDEEGGEAWVTITSDRGSPSVTGERLGNIINFLGVQLKDIQIIYNPHTHATMGLSIFFPYSAYAAKVQNKRSK